VEILAACHLHSDWSYDGSWSLGALTNAFGGRGYRVLMMTEHDRGFSEERLQEFRLACARASSADVFVLPGIEYSDPDNRVHVLVWGQIPFLGEGLGTDSLLDAVARHGGLAVLAHPARRRAWELVTPTWTDRLLGIELWNRKYDGWAPSASGRDLLSSASALPFVGLDFHTSRQMFPLGMSLTLEGPIVDEPSILACLRRRRCAPRVLGTSLDAPRFRRSRPALEVAERGRRTLARIRRLARAHLSE
jgi:hypothetical protein